MGFPRGLLVNVERRNAQDKSRTGAGQRRTTKRLENVERRKAQDGSRAGAGQRRTAKRLENVERRKATPFGFIKI